MEIPPIQVKESYSNKNISEEEIHASVKPIPATTASCSSESHLQDALNLLCSTKSHRCSNSIQTYKKVTFFSLKKKKSFKKIIL